MEEAIRQSDLSKLPVFQGDNKDPFTAEQWMDRIVGAKRAATWSDENALLHMKNAMRKAALLWFENLERSIGLAASQNFNAVSRTFLKTYSKVRTARTATTNLAEVRQGNAETVNDYYNRVLAAINDLQALMPPAALTRPATADAFPASIKALAGWDAVTAAHKHATIQNIMELAATQTYSYVGLQHFIANLKPVFRDELMKKNPTTLFTAFEQAAELENIQATPNRFVAGPVTEVEDEEDVNEVNDGIDQEIEAINVRLRALQTRRNQRGSARGRGPSRGRGANRGNRGNRGGATNSGSTMQCWYCKKNGHHQDDCYSRKNAGAPKVNRSGQPAVNDSGETPAAPATQPQVIYAWPPGAHPFQPTGPPQGSNYEYLTPIQHGVPSVAPPNQVFY
jgi:hypothetical protein